MAGKTQIADISQFLGQRTDTPASKCPTNYSPDCSDMTFSPGGMATRNPFRAQITLPAEMVWREEFTCKNGTVQVIALDVNGILYSVAANGTTTVIDTVSAGSQVSSVVAYGQIYMAFFNATGGCDAPRFWDGTNIYRVSSGAPGAAPTFTPVPNTDDTYAIDTITQPASQSRGSSYFLRSAGPGSTSPGTTITVYYSDSTLAGPDADLVSAFTSGFPVYLYFDFTGGPAPYGPITVEVSGVGEGQPPTQPRNFYYFTFEDPTGADDYTYFDGAGHPGYVANYQRSLATLNSAVPIPGAAIGDNITITGTSEAQYNATWPIEQTPNSGDLEITQSSLTGGTANYSYNVASGVPPVVGQTITIVGLTNGPLDPTTGNSILNVTNGVIATASGGSIGSFTINGFPAGTYPSAPESGDGVTAGNVFLFDPGLLTIGTANSPIFGNSVGGLVIFANATEISIASGRRQAVVFFIYPEEYTTGVTAITSFSIPANTKSITTNDLPIGPGPCIGRGVAFTQALGSKFFYLDVPQQVAGITMGTSTVVMDNTSTSATFTFADLALAGGQGIDLPGNNLFQQVPLNLPRGVDWYEDRLFWIGEKNTVIGLQNLGFDGGTNGTDANPLGWNDIAVGSIAPLGISPVYVVVGPSTGEINQPAALTPAGAALIQPKLNYSLRFWNDGAGETGLFQAYLQSASTGFSSVATYDLSTIKTAGYYTMNFSLTMPSDIPADLVFGIKYLGLVGTSKIRDMQLIYADNPNRNPIARSSYVKNPQAYDALTGDIGPNDDSTELRAIFRLQESFHFITERGLYDVQAIGNSEPSSWDPDQVSDKCGAFNANAVTTGKGWAAWAGSDGAFWYSGGIPEKTSAIIKPTWKNVANVTNVFDDSEAELVYFGLIAADGTRSMEVYDYHEVGLGGSGKWCPWNRPVRWICDSSTGTTFLFGAKFYELDAVAGVEDDDLGMIGGYYTFAPIGATMFKKQYDYLGFRINGVGPMTPFLYTQTLQGAPFTLNSFNIEDLLDTVAEWPSLSLSARLLYLKLGQAGVQFSLEDVTSLYQGDPNAPISGVR